MISVIFSYGFRPFFFGASLYAALIMPLWILSYMGVFSLDLPSPISSWHVHEMVFGFVVASAAGFILTAMPNWTRTKPLQGLWLGGLFVLWVAGRLSMFAYFSLPLGLAAFIDVSFLVVLTAFTARQLIVSGNYKNLIICGVFTSMAMANIFMHMEFLGLIDWGATLVQTWVIDTVLLLITILGGRVIPAFTRNWLNSNGHQINIQVGTVLDKLSMLSVLALLVAHIVMPESVVTGIIAIFAGVANVARLSSWHGMKTLSHPLLWVLHLAYMWLCISLFLTGFGCFFTSIPESTGLHAAGIGAAGTLIAAVLTRASLGHTGRALMAPSGITFAYLCISVAAIVRIVAELSDWVDRGNMLYGASALWVLGFTIITIIYTPILLGPSKD